MSSGVSLCAIAIIAAHRAVAINVMVLDVARALVVVNVEQRESSLLVAMSSLSHLSHRRPCWASPIVPSLPVRPRLASPIVARQAIAILVTRQARADGSAADPNASRAKQAPLPPLCHRRSRLVSSPTLTQSEQSEVDFVARCSLRHRHHRLRRRPSRRRHHHHSFRRRPRRRCHCLPCRCRAIPSRRRAVAVIVAHWRWKTRPCAV